MLDAAIQIFKNFRNKLHATFPKRQDATLELTDAIAGNTQFKSPVALSLSALFSRGYCSVHDSVDNFFQAVDPIFSSTERSESQMARLRQLSEFLPEPEARPFYLLATDATPAPRPFSPALEDCHVVHQPNPAPGNKPIVIGHQFSIVAILPERDPKSPPWVIPMRTERILSGETETNTAFNQIGELLSDNKLPFSKTLTVNVADSSYGVASFLGKSCELENLVTIVRSRSNRVFYYRPDSSSEQPARGRPEEFGKQFKMKDPNTWGDADQIINYSFQRPSGQRVVIKLEVWNNLLMRGKQNVPMNNNPFTLIRASMLNEDGTLVFKRPLWLIVIGKRKDEISPIDAWLSYRQRYDLEHYFRFGKGKLLMTSYQTPDVEHEENWWEIVGLAYFQLWMARPLAQSLPYPWERYAQLASDQPRPLGPSQVQKDFGRIIRQIEGDPPQLKPRGKSPGRAKGDKQERRIRHPIVFKGEKKAA